MDFSNPTSQNSFPPIPGYSPPISREPSSPRSSYFKIWVSRGRRNPSILLRSLNGQIIPCIQLVRSFVETDENVIKVLKRSKWLLSFNPDLRMQPNIALLRDHNVPDSRIAHLIIKQPGSLLLKTESLKETVESVEKLGFKPESGLFTIAIHTLCSMSKSTWEAELKLLKELGWSEEEIFSAFKRMPILLACSENKMKEGMNFFVGMPH
ncbi:hypothetical protein HHK36_017016 [Tetracentron sinense]|uniref:Uncharacterized protein n=1 Tax=Tetracentron sinense TaxID=13715 RepID=A0A834Z0K6_TETSI|nr:hypothetical protein HHK36_017016 [Tetracentron sinense]